MNGSSVDRVFRTDIVVVGSGIAGMTAALGLAPLSVTILTKREAGGGSSSRLAQGGVAVALGEDDSPHLHAIDTLQVGCGLSKTESVSIITQEGPELINRLISMGAQFDSDKSGRVVLGREAAHSRRRIVHANGDATGAEIVRVLVEAVARSPRIRVEEGFFAGDLVVEGGRVVGVLGQSSDGKTALYQAGGVVLASGGVGSLYRYSTNPLESTADGIAMAARAGVRLVDLEFVQFHPTALAYESSPLPLLTEALRGEGAVLVDSDGDRFMVREHPLAELAPRDTVSRAIWRMETSGKQVFLDAREAVGKRFPTRFPTVYKICRNHGYDPVHEPVPVTPAAHYHIGGVATDSSGKTSLGGLWACGETAATGVHGANRLASNSLLEALVFGQRVAASIRTDWHPRNLLPRVLNVGAVEFSAEDELKLKNEIRDIMWRNVGLVRSRRSLEEALSLLEKLSLVAAHRMGEVQNMLTACRLITLAALMRQESRGVHFRSDFPESRAEWDRRIYFNESEEHVAVLAQAK